MLVRGEGGYVGAVVGLARFLVGGWLVVRRRVCVCVCVGYEYFSRWYITVCGCFAL